MEAIGTRRQQVLTFHSQRGEFTTIALSTECPVYYEIFHVPLHVDYVQIWKDPDWFIRWLVLPEF